jgi:7-cyano-7-deazaguanine synthase
MSQNSASAVCLLSGGLDSLAAVALHIEGIHSKDLPSQLITLTLDYGQRAAKEEINSAKAISAHYGISNKVIEVPWLGELGGSSLTDESLDLEEPEKDSLDDLSEGIKRAQKLWVPNRNGLFLNIAASISEALGFSGVILGFNREEAATFPDNSKEFMISATESLSFSTLKKVKVFSPTVDLTKKEIFKELLRLDAPLPLIWSCYQSGEKMCGECESCKRLLRASEGHSGCNLKF